MDQYFKKLKEHKSIELTSNEAVKQAVLAGLGYSIIPLIGIKNELSNKELNIIPSEGLPIVSSWRLVWLKEKKLSPLAEAYLQYVRKEKEEIIKSSFQWYLDYGNNLKIGK
jgi:DNA-binding transcriptional LysR family regulator